MTEERDFETSAPVIAGWVGLIRRRLLSGLLVFGLIVSVTAIVLNMSRPVYRADARLRIGEPPPNPGVTSATSLLGMGLRLGGDPFANDLELISSRTVTDGVVRDVVLNVRVIAPRGWHRDSLFTGLSAADSTIRASFEATWTTPTTIAVRQIAPRPAEVGSFTANTPARFGGLELIFRARKKNGPERITIVTLPRGEAITQTSTRVQVVRTRRDANVIQLVTRDRDPDVARKTISSVIERYLALRTTIQKRESGQNVDSLRAVARHTLAELTRAEVELENLQRSSRLVDPNAQNEAFVLRYSSVMTELETARSQLAALESVLERSGTAENAAQRWTKLLAFPLFLQNETVGSLLAQINLLEQQRVQLAPRRTAENLEYAVVLDKLAYIDRSLAALAGDVRTTLKEQVARLEAQVDRMDAALAAIPSQAIELARRQRSARVLTEVLVLTEQRLRQEEVRQALSFANVQVIDPPALRYKPVWPRKKFGLAVGILLAGLSAVFTMIVLERADRRIRRASEVMRITGAPVLGLAVRAKDGLRFTASELSALVQHASVNGRGPLRVLVAPVGNTSPNELIALLRSGLPAPTAPGTHGAEVLEAAAIADFASASAAAATGVPVTLMLEAGRTTRDELQRVAGLLARSGATIGGSIVVCSPVRAGEVWQ
jgi:uncharacterized protein involved in exopolysaccharide biosynthesis